MKYKNITRMEYKTPYGWMVRFYYNKKAYRKFFNDSKCGGKNLALLTALSWMKNTKQKIGIPDTHLPVTGVAKSNTGIRGVSFSAKSNKYFVSWCDAHGKPCATSFSVNKYGKEKAFKLACAKRKTQEEWRLAGNILSRITRKSQRIKEVKRYNPDELIKILRDKKQELNRLPTTRDFKDINPKYNRYETAFGGWNKALEAAGLTS
jgi:hypothetical protein